MLPPLPEKAAIIAASPACGQPKTSQQLPQCDWVLLITRIQRGDQSASEELYNRLQRGLRIVLIRRIGIELAADALQDVFLHLLAAIKKGCIRQPESLPSYALGIVNKTVSGRIRCIVDGRRHDGGIVDDRIPDSRDTPEGQLIEKNHMELMVRVLKEMKPLEQELLRRFYLHGHSPEQICRDLSMSDTRYRLLKSRAKAQLVEATQRAMRKGPVSVLKRAIARTA